MYYDKNIALDIPNRTKELKIKTINYLIPRVN